MSPTVRSPARPSQDDLTHLPPPHGPGAMKSWPSGTVTSCSPDVEQLEQDLAQLARHRLGFQHPTALTGLRHLLGLAVVEREAGYNADLPEARVLALRPVLQKVIARVRNPTTREALQIYFFLDSQRPELRSSTLSARRTEIVRRLPFQDEQWRRGLEDRFRAILAGEVRSYEVEHRLASQAALPPGTVPVKLVQTAAEMRSELERLVDETASTSSASAHDRARRATSTASPPSSPTSRRSRTTACSGAIPTTT